MVRGLARRRTPPTWARSAPTQAAELAAAGFHDAVPLRQCTHRLSLRTTTPACALAELGRCPAPCEHRITPEEYDAPRRRAVPHRHHRRPAGWWWTPCWPGSRRSPATQRYEEAAVVRSRLAAVLRAAVRMQRLAALTGIAELAAARPAAAGRLGAGAGPARPAGRRRGVPAGRPPATDHRRDPGHRRDGASRATVRCPRATAEETERILSWLERPETRLVEMTSGWASPVAGAGRFRDLLAKAESGAVPPTLDRTLMSK